MSYILYIDRLGNTDYGNGRDTGSYYDSRLCGKTWDNFVANASKEYNIDTVGLAGWIIWRDNCLKQEFNARLALDNTGSKLIFDNESDAMMFILRWS